MDKNDAAKQLEAMGNTTRLSIIQHLVKSDSNGINVGDINKILSIPSSTLSHHLAKLVNVGLVSQQRKGRELVCRTEPDAMDRLVMYLADNCCGDDSGIWG